MKITVLVPLLTVFGVYSCPITITNNSPQVVMMVDPKGSEAIFLKEGNSAVIDPTVTYPILKYIMNEKMDVYFPQKDDPNKFFKKYRITEKYCSDDPKENVLTITQIIDFVKSPTKRFPS